MKIAHFSDLHVLALDGVPRLRLMTNKRLTGYANILLNRGKKHRLEVVRSLAQDLRSAGVDHVVVTGDLSNLALETEFQAVHQLLERDLGFSPDAVTLVPGNHDRYTRGSHRSRRFELEFEAYLRSDLELPEAFRDDCYPVVKLRGPVALVGLATAVPRLPFVAAGEVGPVQLRALSWILKQPEVSRRTLVLLTHHPVAEPMTGLHAYLEGLRDAQELRTCLQTCSRGLALHGHLHRSILRVVPTRAGEIWSVGVTSASLVHESNSRMAGYNVYEISETGVIERLRGRVMDLETGAFRDLQLAAARG